MQPHEHLSRLNIDLDSAVLSATKKEQLLDLLADISDLFATLGGQLGRTGVVKHDVHMTGPPIHQPLRRLPMKGVVQDEVHKMLVQ